MKNSTRVAAALAARARGAALTTVSSTVLLTGFDPFGGSTLNPSWLAVNALHGEQVLGHRIVAAQLPTVFGESLRVLDALLPRPRTVGFGAEPEPPRKRCPRIQM